MSSTTRGRPYGSLPPRATPPFDLADVMFGLPPSNRDALVEIVRRCPALPIVEVARIAARGGMATRGKDAVAVFQTQLRQLVKSKRLIERAGVVTVNATATPVATPAPVSLPPRVPTVRVSNRPSLPIHLVLPSKLRTMLARVAAGSLSDHDATRLIQTCATLWELAVICSLEDIAFTQHDDCDGEFWMEKRMAWLKEIGPKNVLCLEEGAATTGLIPENMRWEESLDTVVAAMKAGAA